MKVGGVVICGLYIHVKFETLFIHLFHHLPFYLVKFYLMYKNNSWTIPFVDHTKKQAYPHGTTDKQQIQPSISNMRFGLPSAVCIKDTNVYNLAVLKGGWVLKVNALMEPFQGSHVKVANSQVLFKLLSKSPPVESIHIPYSFFIEDIGPPLISV